MHATVPSATRLCGLTASMATLALVVVALAGPASRGPLGLVGILRKEEGVGCQQQSLHHILAGFAKFRTIPVGTFFGNDSSPSPKAI